MKTRDEISDSLVEALNLTMKKMQPPAPELMNLEYQVVIVDLLLDIRDLLKEKNG